MKRIIVLGAGQVGTSVAEALAGEANNELTLVDTNAQALQGIQERVELRTVVGHASHPAVLAAAGAWDADMLVAVTNSDEVNMVACQVAHTVFHIGIRIARVRAPEYLDHPELLQRGAIAIDTVISPEKIVTDHILRLIEYPGALQVLDFGKGKAYLVGVRAVYGSPLVGAPLAQLRQNLPHVDARVLAVYRRTRLITPRAETVFEEDDEVFFITAKDQVKAVMAQFCPQGRPARNLFLVGGGNIGRRLATALEGDHRVKVLERNTQRRELLSRELTRTVVLSGDATEIKHLQDENIENVDIFCAVTNDDEANILSAMLAKRLGARKVMAIINRAAYAKLMHAGLIDVVISPQEATIGSLLARIRRGDMQVVHALRRGQIEAVEIIAHGDPKTSAVLGRRLDRINLPRDITISALVRGEQVLMAHGDTQIEAGDHVILFIANKDRIGEVERLFAVDAKQ